MNDDCGPCFSVEEPHCSWCGALLRGQEPGRVKIKVCSKCVRLLTDAGLTDAEIFSGDVETYEQVLKKT